MRAEANSCAGLRAPLETRRQPVHTDRMTHHPFTLAGIRLHALPSGALHAPDHDMLVVSDLHFGKSERLARRGGALLPPYETRETLARLDRDIAATAPGRVICLGDSFDDSAASGALSEPDRLWLIRLMTGRDWTWITGNHDPAPLGTGPLGRSPLGTGTLDPSLPDPRGCHPVGLTVEPRAKPHSKPRAEFHAEHFAEIRTEVLTEIRTEICAEIRAEIRVGPITLRHIASPDTPEISGHYHPKARLAGRAAPCFLIDAARVILPAYGTYTGGLACDDPALAALMTPDARAVLTGRSARAIPMPRKDRPPQIRPRSSSFSR